MTYLAIPIKVESPGQAMELIRRAAAAGAEMLELRLDYLAEPTPEVVRQVVAAAKDTALPVIATCRGRWEGGAFAGDENERNCLLAQAVMAGADHVDIEAAARMEVGQIAGDFTVKVIRSFHDFDGVPSDLSDCIERIEALGPDVAKVAYTARTASESFAVLDWMHAQALRGQQVIAMAMGEAGLITRLLAGKLGAFLSYATLADAQGTAPGQVTIEEMTGTYRWGRVVSDTTVYGVIGYPIGHSLRRL